MSPATRLTLQLSIGLEPGRLLINPAPTRLIDDWLHRILKE
jgi:hypothetical protein